MNIEIHVLNAHYNVYDCSHILWWFGGFGDL